MRTSSTLWLFLVAAGCLLSACGGGGGSSDAGAASAPVTTAPAASTPAAAPTPAVPVNVALAANVLALKVDGGSNGAYVNGLFASVTLCQPGTSNCQTIDRVLVDTGSVGLRVLATALDGTLLAALPAQRGAITDGGVNPLAECAQFVSGYAWGSVRAADAQMSGERASSLPVQVIGDTAAVGAVPANCSRAGGASLNSADTLGANGILGVGLFVNDCPACTSTAVAAVYYTCTAAGRCTAARVPATSQVTNPVAVLAVNNNGVVINMPAIPSAGQAGATGTLTFGIGTQSNNAMTTSRVLRTDANGYFQTSFNGTVYASSFLDSGSNGYFFPSTTLPVCSSVWYCPAVTTSLTATMFDAAGATPQVASNPQAVSFDVANFNTLSASGNKALVNLAGPASNAFDFGLPFFYGRNVYTAIQGRVAGPVTGPYVAF